MRAPAPEQGCAVVEAVQLPERLPDDPERLVEAVLALLEAHAEAEELVGLVAAPEPQLETASAQAIDHRRLLDDPDRVVLERQDDHAGAEPDAPGLAGRRRGHEQAVGHQRVAREVMLREPARPVPELVQEPHLGELVLVALLAGLPVATIAEDELGEVHGARASTRRMPRPAAPGATSHGAARPWRRRSRMA